MNDVLMDEFKVAAVRELVEEIIKVSTVPEITVKAQTVVALLDQILVDAKYHWENI